MHQLFVNNFCGHQRRAVYDFVNMVNIELQSVDRKENHSLNRKAHKFWMVIDFDTIFSWGTQLNDHQDFVLAWVSEWMSVLHSAVVL